MSNSWWDRFRFARLPDNAKKEADYAPAKEDVKSASVNPKDVDTSIVSIERPQFGTIGTAFARPNLDDLVGKKGLKIYAQMRLDEQVKAVVTFKRDAIISRGWLFAFDEESKLSETEQKRRIRIFNKIIEKMPGTFIDSLNKISVGREYGYSISEKVYMPLLIDEKWQVGIRAIKGRDPNTFEFFVDEYGELQKFQQIAAGKRIELDLAKFIHYVHNPEFDEYLGRSDLREAYRSWFFKEQMLKFWAFYSEKLGGGALVVSIGPTSTIGAGTPAYTALQKIVENFKSSGGIVLPKDVTAELVFPSTSDNYEKACTWFDLAIARALLVPNLLGVSHTGQTGAYAQSQTQLEAFAWTLKADADRLEACINEQLFYDLGEQNFGDQEYPCFKFKTPTNEHVKWLITSWKEMIAAGSVVVTEDDEKRVREILEMPLRTKESVLLVDPAAEADKEHDVTKAKVGHELSEEAKDKQVDRGINEEKKKRATFPEDYENDEDKPVTKKELKALLYGWDESEHPRDERGRFGDGDGDEPGLSDREVSKLANNSENALDLAERAEEAMDSPSAYKGGKQATVSASKASRRAQTTGKADDHVKAETAHKAAASIHGSSRIGRMHERAAAIHTDILRKMKKAGVEQFTAHGGFNAQFSITPHEARLNLASAREKVDFAIIDRKQKLHFEQLSSDVSIVVARTVKQLLGSDEELSSLIDSDTSDIANLDVPGVARGRIKGAFKNALANSWALGRQLANEELGRSKVRRKPKDMAHFASLRDKAADYFENNGFRMAGNVSDGVRALMQNELQNAVKYGKSPKQTRESIWDRLTAKGFASRESVRDVEDTDGVVQALDALWVDTEEGAAHYLDTLARTNLFEAMNEARYGEFTDPALEGFVVAFRYSAILDERTTTVCEALHDSVYEADSELWNAYRPPNHFNCRSILIPVTQIDVQNGEWNGVESDEPDVTPQEGFK